MKQYKEETTQEQLSRVKRLIKIHDDRTLKVNSDAGEVALNVMNNNECILEALEYYKLLLEEKKSVEKNMEVE